MSKEAPVYGPGPAQVRRGERTPADRAQRRADELLVLAEAYAVAGGAHLDGRISTVLNEALKLWEREHLPEPLDKLLLDRAMGRA